MRSPNLKSISLFACADETSISLTKLTNIFRVNFNVITHCELLVQRLCFICVSHRFVSYCVRRRAAKSEKSTNSNCCAYFFLCCAVSDSLEQRAEYFQFQFPRKSCCARSLGCCCFFFVRLYSQTIVSRYHFRAQYIKSFGLSDALNTFKRAYIGTLQFAHSLSLF